MAKAFSLTIKLVNSVTSGSVNSLTFAIWVFANKHLHIELVPYSDGWQRTWWQMIHMIPGLQLSLIPQGKQNHHDGECTELFHAIGRFELTFIEAHQISKIRWKVRSLKSQIKTHSFGEEIITSSKEVFKDYESDMELIIRKLGNLSWKTTECNLTV